MTRAASTPAAPANATRLPKATRPERTAASRATRRRSSRLATIVFAVILAGFVVAFVYPTRTFLRQRTELSAAETRLQVLERETKALQADSARLGSDAEIERVAREQYGLIRPGETPFVLVPESTTPTTAAASTTAPAG